MKWTATHLYMPKELQMVITCVIQYMYRVCSERYIICFVKAFYSSTVARLGGLVHDQPQIRRKCVNRSCYISNTSHNRKLVYTHESVLIMKRYTCTMHVTRADANWDFHSLPPSCSAYLVSISTCDVLLLASSTCEHWLVCFSCTSFTLDSSSVNFALNHSIVRLSTVSWPGESFPDVSSTRLLSNVKGTGEAGVVLQYKTVLVASGKNAPEFQKMILLQF